MKEDFLHYVWRTQQFNKEGLQTGSGERVQVVQVGDPNEDAGPDFLEGGITVDKVAWRGDIEVHVRSSDWYVHRHDRDVRYNTVVLHVVWEDNRKTIREDGTVVPTLALKDRVGKGLLGRYEGLLQHPPATIPCSSHFLKVKKSVYDKMLSKALLARFAHKSHGVQQLLRRHHDDAEVTAYLLLGHNFGFKVNGETFLELVKRVPLSLLRQHRPNLLSLEALLLGQAGFLFSKGGRDDLEKDYVQELIERYDYLRSKHRLEPMLYRHAWKFSRLRPANFPTIRIAQFARLLHLYPYLFPLLVNSTPAQLKEYFAIEPSPYWQHHYLIGKKSDRKIGGLGVKSIENIMINTVVPLLVAYGRLRGDDFFSDKAMALLRSLPAEDNKIVREWRKIGWVPQDAFESQACIELFKQFCQPKRCLSCEVGKRLLRSAPSKRSLGEGDLGHIA